MIHGGDVYTHGFLEGREIIDFSSNINPFGVPKSFLEHLNEGVEALVRYPDIKYRRLRESLSKYLNTDSDKILLGNGAAELLDLAISSLKSATLLVPSFAEYELSCKKWGVDLNYVYFKEEFLCEDKSYEFSVDYKKVLDSFKNTEGLIIANPNNPNGSILDKNLFKEILDYAEENHKIILIDEAFIEFTGDKENSLCSLIEKYKCLFIVRALTKFFGMPGIRLGYAVTSNENFKNKLEEKQNPWNINSFAEIAGTFAIWDKDYIEKSLKWVECEKAYMDKALKEIDYIEKVYKTHGNFVLVKLKALSCEELYEKMLEKNILIRRANNYKGLDDYYVRFAIKDRYNNEILINALNSL